MQILVDHVQHQGLQLSRMEDLLTAFGTPTSTVWAKLAAKADVSRLEKLEVQVETALNDLSNLRAKQVRTRGVCVHVEGVCCMPQPPMPGGAASRGMPLC